MLTTELNVDSDEAQLREVNTMTAMATWQEWCEEEAVVVVERRRSSLTSSSFIDFNFVVVVCVIAHVKRTSKRGRVQVPFYFSFILLLLIVDCICHGV